MKNNQPPQAAHHANHDSAAPTQRPLICTGVESMTKFMVNSCRKLWSRFSEIGSHFYHFPAVFKLLSESSSRTLFVEVHHSGDPLHKEADRLAVEGAFKESDNEDTLYPGDRDQETVFNWVDHTK